MTKNLTVVFMLVVMTALSTSADAGLIWWGDPGQVPPGGDANWGNASNWNGGAIPGAGDQAGVNVLGNPYPMFSSGDRKVYDLLDGYWDDSGMTMTGGTLGVYNVFAVGYKGGNYQGPAGNATFTMTGGHVGSLVDDNYKPAQLWVGYSEDADYKINGTLNMTGGRIDARWAIEIGGGAGNTVGQINLNSGEIHLQQTLNIASGSNLDLDGGTLYIWNIGGGKSRGQINAMITSGLITGAGIVDNVNVTEFDNGSGGTGFALDQATIEKKVSYPYPHDGEADIRQAVTLTWTADTDVVSHDVYFGTDENAVETATTSTPGIYKTNRTLGSESYAVSGLVLGQKYYWRIDEITSTDTYQGDVFTFRVEPFPIIEDFEEYTSNLSLRLAWSDGNSHTSLILEDDIIGKCMLVNYIDNRIVRRTFPTTEDFSGKQYINVMLKGDAANSDDMLSLIIKDNASQTSQRTLFRYSGLTNPKWRTYSVPLDSFTGIDLTNIQEITLAFSSSPASGDNTGQLYIDEITLTDDKRSLDADVDGDGVVGLPDITLIAGQWLESETAPSQEPQDAVVWYDFDDGAGLDVTDSSSNGYDATLTSAGQWFGSGGHDGGGYISFDGSFQVDIPNADTVFGGVNTTASVSFWINGVTESTGSWIPIFHATKTGVNRIFMSNIPTPASQLMCSMGADTTQNFVGDTLWWNLPDSSYHYNNWNHYVFTKDSVTGEIKVYHNGAPVATLTDAFYAMSGIDQFVIGGACDGQKFSGRIDDFRVFDRVLNTTEITALSGTGGSSQQLLSNPKLDIWTDGIINLGDVAVVAADWLEEKKPAVWYDAQFLRYDERSMLEALQGLVNRDGPRLFMNLPAWDSSPDGQWVDIYSQRNGVTFKSDITTLEGLLDYFSDYYNGFAVYDPAIDGSRYVAMTMAGIHDVLPVSPSILNGYCPDIALTQGDKWGGVNFETCSKDEVLSSWEWGYGGWICDNEFVEGVGLTTKNTFVNTLTTDRSLTVYGPFVADLDNYPKLEVKVGNVSSGASWGVYLTHDNDGDGVDNVVFVGSGSGTGTFTYNLSSVSSSSNQRFNRILLETNGTAAEVTWEALRFRDNPSSYAPIVTPNAITAVTGKSVLYDLRGQFTDTLDAYQWMLDNLVSIADTEYAHVVAGPVDGVITGGGPWDSMNYAIMKRGLIFNLSFNYTDTFAFGVDYVGVPAQANMYRSLLTALDDAAFITGYGDDENNWFQLMNEYGKRYNVNQYHNMSFHAVVPPRKPYLRQKKHYTTSNTEVEADKYYVCFISSDGDSMKPVVTQHYEAWDKDPERGSFPYNFAIPTDSGDSIPALTEYYYDTATDNDYMVPIRCMFLNAASGVGEPLYDRMGLELEAGDFSVMTNCVIDNPMSNSAGYADYLDRLGVMGSAEIKWAGSEDQKVVVLPNGEIATSVTCDGLLGYSKRALAGGDWGAPEWPVLYADQVNWASTVSQFVTYVDNVANSHTPPFVILVYPSLHSGGLGYTIQKDIADALDPAKFKVTRLDEAMAAIKKHNE